MRIGLIGAPGSGKSALAETVKTAVGLTDDRENLHIIDGYAEGIGQRRNLAIGEMGGYLANLNIALHREQLERQALVDHDALHVITCGTLLDTATYVAMDGASMLKYDDEAERLDDLRRVEATMKVLACLYIDAFKYDRLFYLPSGAGEFDKNLQVAFQAFNLVEVTPLMEGGHSAVDVTEKRCVQVLEAIHKGV
jgi:hypothetical protein